MCLANSVLRAHVGARKEEDGPAPTIDHGTIRSVGDQPPGQLFVPCIEGAM